MVEYPAVNRGIGIRVPLSEPFFKLYAPVAKLVARARLKILGPQDVPVRVWPGVPKWK